MDERPDLVLIMTDQQRFDQVGYSSGGFETPNIDRLAESGVIFENAYSSSTTCVPARSALLTGLHHHRVPKQAGSWLYLREGFWTVARALRQVGYATAFVGKMHASPIRADHGFEEMRLCEHLFEVPGMYGDEVDDYHEWLLANGLEDWRPVRPIEWVKRVGTWFPYDDYFHPTAWVEREARSVLAQRDPEKPLLLIVSFPHPHSPFNPPESYWSRFDPESFPLPSDGFEVNLGLPGAFRDIMIEGAVGRSRPERVDEGERGAQGVLTRIRALVAQIDDSVGQIMHDIDLGRSLVFFTADHGDYAGHRGLLHKNPWVPFDDLARVPFAVTGFDVVGRRRLAALVQNCDFALTCLDYAGADIDPSVFDTQSLRPHLVCDADVDANRAVLCATSTPWPMIRRGPIKLIVDTASDDAVLFDLARDPGETVDRKDDREYGDVRRELSERLAQNRALGIPDLPL